jgi:phage-related minor tail protein
VNRLTQTQGVLTALKRLSNAISKGIKYLSKDTRTAGTAASAAVEEALADSAVGKALGSLRAKMAASGLMFATTVSYSFPTLRSLRRRVRAFEFRDRHEYDTFPLI